MKSERSKFSLWAAALAILVASAGCASKVPLAPNTAPEARDYEYRIGPGDSVNVQVWRNPELSLETPVRPDGRITTPLVEDVPAAGKTPTELARDMEKQLTKYIQEPVVTVIVKGFLGRSEQHIRVVGEAAKPLRLPYSSKMTLLDVMIAVGGITDFADGNKATIVRSSGEGTQQLRVRLRDLLKAGDITANVEMQPGDVLIIPESFF